MWSRVAAGFAVLASAAKVSRDLELLDRWRSGDKAAGDELFARHVASLRRFFRNKIREDPDDLIQRTFLGIVEGRDRFEGRSSFRTYLFGVARNVLSNHLRARPRTEESLAVDSSSPITRDPAPSQSVVVARHREQRVLLEALRNLPVEVQIALELYYWEDMSARELGEVLEIPEGTARSRIRRGKILLEQELERLGAHAADLAATRTTLDEWARKLRDSMM